jgi:hypothetical protein
VARYIADHLVPYQVHMGDRAAGPLFRANHVIWTPSAGLADHKGNVHYLVTGFTPPAEFLSALRIGRARCLMAWLRYADAVTELEQAVADGNTMAPEALFWLAAAYYFAQRDTTPMYATWAALVARYPDSPWARHTYPPPPVSLAATRGSPSATTRWGVPSAVRSTRPSRAMPERICSGEELEKFSRNVFSPPPQA